MNKLEGYIAINEEHEIFYIPKEDSVELTVMRKLNGQEFDIIDLSKIDDSLVQHLQKFRKGNNARS